MAVSSSGISSCMKVVRGKVYGSRWFTASRWGHSRPSIGGHCSPTGSSGIAPICGSANTSAHNFVFLEGVKAALTARPVWPDGGFATPPTRGFQAMGPVCAGWGLSQAFYREEIWRKIGFSSLEDFLIDSWEANFRRRDANDLLAMLWTWQPHADNSANELAAATSIKHWVQSPPTRP